MIYTSKQILEMDGIPSYDSFHYQLTDGEFEWCNLLKDKYDVADTIWRHADYRNVVYIDLYELSIAMDKDNYGAGKATMLSDETALQKILFHGYREDL